MGQVLSLADVVVCISEARDSGKKIVTTNGAFDLLHPGHLFLLEEARKHGDVLIVGVNNDAQVKRVKGEGRPAETEKIRAEKVAKHADFVFIFAGSDPREFLKAIRPDVHVNAETYGENCIEAEVLRNIGAKLVLVPVRKELGSTTEKIRNINLCHPEQASPQGERVEGKNPKL